MHNHAYTPAIYHTAHLIEIMYRYYVLGSVRELKGEMTNHPGVITPFLGKKFSFVSQIFGDNISFHKLITSPPPPPSCSIDY